jgi:hypothetical protein
MLTDTDRNLPVFLGGEARGSKDTRRHRGGMGWGHKPDGSYWMSPAFVMLFNDLFSIVVTLIRIVIPSFGLVQVKVRTLFGRRPEPKYPRSEDEADLRYSFES